MKYSIVIPAHNEGATIRSFMETFLADLKGTCSGIDFEVIIVENGSKDDTLKQAMLLSTLYPEAIVVLSNSRGSYGEAVKRGILECSGEYVSILECDFLKTKFIEISLRLIRENGARFILASKRHPSSSDKRPIKRRLLTWLFNNILFLTIGYPGSDTHGLKTIKTDLAKSLCVMAQTTDEILQTEIVILAWVQGEQIFEVPITVEEIRSSPVSIRKRFPMVMKLCFEIRRSINRYNNKTIYRKKPINIRF